MDPNRFRTAPMFAAGLAALLVAGAPFAAGAGQGAAGEPRPTAAKATARASAPAAAASGVVGEATLAARNLPLGAPSLRIYRSVRPDGSVAFADRAAPGARDVQIRSYASASDAPAIATAQQQQQHWREHAEAFSRRLRERDEADERERRAREITEAPYVVLVFR